MEKFYRLYDANGKHVISLIYCGTGITLENLEDIENGKEPIFSEDWDIATPDGKVLHCCDFSSLIAYLQLINTPTSIIDEEELKLNKNEK